MFSLAVGVSRMPRPPRVSTLKLFAFRGARSSARARARGAVKSWQKLSRGIGVVPSLGRLRRPSTPRVLFTNGVAAASLPARALRDHARSVVGDTSRNSSGVPSVRLFHGGRRSLRAWGSVAQKRHIHLRPAAGVPTCASPPNARQPCGERGKERCLCLESLMAFVAPWHLVANRVCFGA